MTRTKALIRMIACGLTTTLAFNASAQGVSEPRGATLVVNDSDAVGALGDGKLSLAEAIRLAGGELAIGDLDAGERRQVRGIPGASRRDRIRFAVRGGAVRFPQQIQPKPAMEFAVLTASSKMPTLTHNAGDEIDGKGVRFTNGPDQAVDSGDRAPLGGIGLVVESSRFTIRNATFERFVEGLLFRPAARSDGLSNVSVIDSKFLNGGGISFNGVSAALERSALRNIVISGNQFRGPGEFGGAYPSKLHNAIAVTGANAAVAKDSASAADVVIENVRIVGNIVREFAGGVQVQPLQTLFTVNRGARLTGLTIERNDISLGEDTVDPAVYLWGAVSVNGQVSDVTASDIVVKDNKITGNGHVLFIAGVEALMGGKVASRNIHLRNVQIVGNTIRPRKSCSYGITTIGAFPEMGGPPAEGNSLANVEVRGNKVANCEIGAFASPVLNVGAPGESRDNHIEGLRYDTNRISGARSGIIVAGGAMTSDAFEGEATIRSNHVNGLRLLNNKVEATDDPILIAGGFARGKGAGTVTENTVNVVQVSGNTDIAGKGVAICRAKSDHSEQSITIVERNKVVGAPQTCQP